MNEEDKIWLVSILLVVAICCVGFFGYFQGLSLREREAIQLNHAEYNMTNGNWQWITNSITKAELSVDKK